MKDILNSLKLLNNPHELELKSSRECYRCKEISPWGYSSGEEEKRVYKYIKEVDKKVHKVFEGYMRKYVRGVIIW